MPSPCLVLETGESGYSRLYPSLLVRTSRVIDEIRAVRGHVYPHYEVRRVSGGG